VFVTIQCRWHIEEHFHAQAPASLPPGYPFLFSSVNYANPMPLAYPRSSVWHKPVYPISSQIPNRHHFKTNLHQFFLMRLSVILK
jgi:hypothetical protein